MNAFKKKRKSPKALKGRSLVYSALLSVRKEIKVAFGVAFISIFIFELLIPRPTNHPGFFDTVGNIYLKACYAIFGATIFYFLNVQLPREQKKLKCFIFVYNRVVRLNINLNSIIHNLGLEVTDKSQLTEQLISDALKSKSPNVPIQTTYHDFANWMEYLQHLRNETQTTLQDLLSVQDVIDSSVLEPLFYIENNFNQIGFSHLSANITTENWNNLAYNLFEILYFNEKLSKVMRRSYQFTRQQQREKHYKERIFPTLK